MRSKYHTPKAHVARRQENITENDKFRQKLVVFLYKKSLSFSEKAFVANPVDDDTRDAMHPIEKSGGIFAPPFMCFLKCFSTFLDPHRSVQDATEFSF